MLPKGKNVVADVIQIASSDDEDDGRGSTLPSALGASASMPQPEQQHMSSVIPRQLAPRETLECRSFWKAGDYALGPTSVAPTTTGLLEHARIHPKFLHTNATSHRWAFGAIAELLDNAVDEIQNGATFVKVDKIDLVKDNSPALVFLDDGGGMDPEGIRKCMSLGYSSKKSNTTIGQYGNGFKTSTMRLGADVIVFSRATRRGKATQSVGLLSYTFLRKTGQDDVIVPMIDFDISNHWAEPILYGSQEDWSANLSTILEWSPFASKEELMQQFEDVGNHGTKVIIYNLWLNDEGIYELGLDDDDEDIRLRDESIHEAKKLHKKTAELRSHISYRLRYSLRAYASILYLRKFENFKIILKGKPVQQFNIADELKYPRTAIYKPQGAITEQAATEVKIGFIKEAPYLAVCGFNVYHKNRLIRPFWKVSADGHSKGNGVVGVLEANFIEPAHDKQDFERSSLFVRLESKLKKIFMDYWFCNCHIYGYQSPLMPADKTKRAAVAELPVGNMKRPSPVGQHHSRHPVIQEIRPNDAAVHIPPHSTSVSDRSKFQAMQPDPAIAVSVDNDVTEDEPVYMSPHEVREENIQLFMRYEEYVKKETELQETIIDLEKELEEAKSKCAQLALLVEAKRQEKTLESFIDETHLKKTHQFCFDDK